MKATQAHALYRFFDAEGVLLYIGVTVDPGARWRRHEDGRPWWLEVANVTLERHPTRGAVLRAERAAIIDEHPKYNIVHNRGTHQDERPADVIERMMYWPGWGSRSDDMPDDCHDYCGNAGIVNLYYPYAWIEGKAFYQCNRGHRWPCWWGHRKSGQAPENAGVSHMEELTFDRRSEAPM